VTVWYAPAVRHDFIYDDHLLVVQPPPPRSAGDLLRVFAERHWESLPYYRPLARLTMVGQRLLHGERPAPFHLFNAVVMGALAALLYALLRLPAFAVPPAPAALGALLLAMHPIASSCVYPVCSGRETLLPGLFVVATVYAFLRRGVGWRVCAVAAFAAALLSKESAVVVPIVLVLADALGLPADAPGPDPRRWLGRYAPFLATLLLYLALRRLVLGGAGEYRVAVLEHPAMPALSLIYALQATFAPFVELVYEPRVTVWLSWWRQGLSALAVGALALAARCHWRAVARPVVFWVGWFLVTLLPTANLLHQEAHFDERYALLALAGVVGVGAALAARAWTRPGARRRTAVLGVVLVGACAVVSQHRGRYFRDDAAFLSQWLRTDPGSAEAHYNLGNHLHGRGDLDGAVAHYRAAIAAGPASAEMHHNLGIVFGMRHDYAAAEAQYRAALRLRPEYAIAHNNLGTALRSQGRQAEAVRHFRAAARLDPRLAVAHVNLGRSSHAAGRLAAAIRSYRAALRADPALPGVHNDLGNALVARGRVDEAVEHYRAALRLTPDLVEAHFNLGMALAAQGHGAEAADHLREAVRRSPELGRLLGPPVPPAPGDPARSGGAPPAGTGPPSAAATSGAESR
jgi:tetratricopeptide (TPR) repeat protein